MIIKNKRKRFVIGFTIIASILLVPLMLDVSTELFYKDSSFFSISANGDNFDILDFWENEIERVNNTPLNVFFSRVKSSLNRF